MHVEAPRESFTSIDLNEGGERREPEPEPRGSLPRRPTVWEDERTPQSSRGSTVSTSGSVGYHEAPSPTPPPSIEPAGEHVQAPLTERVSEAVMKVAEESRENTRTRWWQFWRKKPARTFEQIQAEVQRVDARISELQGLLKSEENGTRKKTLEKEIARLGKERQNLYQEKTASGMTYLQDKNKQFITAHEKEQKQSAESDRKRIKETRKPFLEEYYRSQGKTPDEVRQLADNKLEKENQMRKEEQEESKRRASKNKGRDKKRAATPQRKRELSKETEQIARRDNAAYMKKYGETREQFFERTREDLLERKINMDYNYYERPKRPTK